METILRLRRSGREHEVDLLARDADRARVRLDGREIEVQLTSNPNGLAIRIDGRSWPVAIARRGDSIFASAGPYSFEFQRVEDATRRHTRGLLAPEIVAPMPGKVLRVLVKEGQRVEVGEPLIVIEAMKMETTLSAESPAIVKRLRVAAGQMVDHGAVLIELSPAAETSTPPPADQAS